MIKAAVALRDPKARRITGLTLIDGERQVRRALDAGVELEYIFYRELPISKGLFHRGAKAIEVTAAVLAKLAYGQNEEGLVAVARVKVKSPEELKFRSNPLVVVLESLEKPGNLGAILRTCDAAGVDALLIGDPKTDVYNPNVIRASTGAVFTVPIGVGTNASIAAFLRTKKITRVGTFPEAIDAYTQANLKGPIALVLGTEDKGLSDFWQQRCDLKVKIPMKGSADSLNVSVTAAIVIYETLRQRATNP